VDGGGVAVFEVAGGDVVGSEADGRAVDELEVDAAVAANAVDGADHPVVDPCRPPVAKVHMAGRVGAVAQQDDPVAGLELAAANLQHLTRELVCDLQPGEAVEGLGFAARAGQQDPVDPGTVRVGPRGDGLLVDVGGAAGDDDVAVVVVGPEPGLGVAVTQFVEGGVFPLGVLATVDRQLGGVASEEADGGGEDAAGADFGELVVVALRVYVLPVPARPTSTLTDRDAVQRMRTAAA
jgi:hypothetical protein